MTQPFEHRSFDKPEEVREGDNWRLEPVNPCRWRSGRPATIQPGWKWSEHVKPVAGTDLCMAPHQQYGVSGHVHVVMRDVTEARGRSR